MRGSMSDVVPFLCRFLVCGCASPVSACRDKNSTVERTEKSKSRGINPQLHKCKNKKKQIQNHRSENRPLQMRRGVRGTTKRQAARLDNGESTKSRRNNYWPEPAETDSADDCVLEAAAWPGAK